MNFKDKLAQTKINKIFSILAICLMSLTIVYALVYNGEELTDHTIYNETTNICTASNLNMNVNVFPCSAQDLDGKNIIQYVDFKWDGINPQGTSWVFVYDGNLESGKIEVETNQSYQDTIQTEQWVANYLLDNVLSYNNLTGQNYSCELGTETNTQKFNVTYNNVNQSNYTSQIICFETVVPINATAFYISGWADLPEAITKYRTVWVDHTDDISYMGFNLLDQNLSYYQIQNITFQTNQELKTKWTYTPGNNEKSGKWSIFGYPSTLEISEAISQELYIFLDPWWNDTFDYTRPLKIKENSANTLTNYSVLLNITYDSDMQTDFDDLRFTNVDNDTELDYWIEEKVDSSWVSVWVKVPGLTASVNTTIYMYYGNSDVSTTSNFDDAFFFADSFSGTSLDTSKWSTTGSDYTISVSGGALHITKGITQATWLRMVGLVSLNASKNYIYESNEKSPYAFCNYVVRGFSNATTSDYPTGYDNMLYILSSQSSTDKDFRTRSSGVNTITADFTHSNVYEVFKMWKESSSSVRFTINGSQARQSTTNIPSTKLNVKIDHYVCGHTSAGGVMNSYIDWVRVREYISPEPSYILGDEETQAPANTVPTLTANATSPSPIYENQDWLINLTATDPEETYIDSYVQFYVNDSKVGGEFTFNMTNNTNHLVATLGNGNFSGGDNLIAEVWLSDGTENTTKVNLTETVSSIFNYSVTQSLTTTDDIDKVYSTDREISQFFSLNIVVNRIGSFLTSITQILNIDIIVDKILNRANSISTDYFMTLVNYPTSPIERTASIFRNPFQDFNIDLLFDRLLKMFRSPIQIVNLNISTEKIANFFRSLSDNFSLNIFTERLGGFFSSISQSFNIDLSFDRLLNLSRSPIQIVDVDTSTDRTASISKQISQFFQFFFDIFLTRTYAQPWNYIDSNETKIQVPALEGEIVYWNYIDNWTVQNVTGTFTNITKSYILPQSAEGINIFIDDVNYTGTSWVSNVSNNWTITNNKTLGALDSSLINFTYNTDATSSEEATWLAYNKRVGENTTWRNTITMINPSTEDYTNIGINITTDSNAIASTVSVKNSTGDLISHTFTSGNVNFTHGTISGNSVFTIEYKTSEINLSQTNYTTEVGLIKTYYNLTISTNSSRDVKTTYAFFSFTDGGIVLNRFYKCTNDTFSDCTEDITTRVDVNFDDLSGDGREDFVEWFITTMNNDTPGTYQLVSNAGFPIQITETEEILNAPIKPFDTISWRTTIAMYNPNSFATEKILKYEFPTGVRDIQLDNIGKNLQYDPFGILQPYITIIDSDDTEHPTSVYLSPGETKTFTLTYKTDSITVFTSTFFPDYFKASEKAKVTKVLRIKNQAEKDVSDLEHRIVIDYAEDLTVCIGEYERGCPEKGEGDYKNVTIDTDSLVKGDYKLEVDSIEAGETKLITLTYHVPTANLEKEENGRRSIDGILTNFRKYDFLSVAHFTMDDVRYRESEIPCTQIIDVLACRANGICDIPLVYTCDTNLKLGSFGVGERKTVYVWYIGDDESEAPSLWFRILNFGQRYYLEKGSSVYYLFGFFGVEENGQLYITTGRVIILMSTIMFIILSFISILYFGNKAKFK